MNKRILLKLAMLILIVYGLVVFVNQQITLASYKSEQEYISSKINEEQQYNKSLTSKKDNINSDEYIEEMARTKLDMYMPNERIYIDIGK